MDLGSPSHLQRERRRRGTCGKDGSGEGISSPCRCGAWSCRARVAVGGRRACHTARPARCDCGYTPLLILPTRPGCCTCPPPRGTSARAFLFPPALQAGGAASIFPRVQEGQRLFSVVLMGLRLPQIASRREALHYPPCPTPRLAHSLAGMFPSRSDLFTHLLVPQNVDPLGLPLDLPSWRPLAKASALRVWEKSR